MKTLILALISSITLTGYLVAAKLYAAMTPIMSALEVIK